MSLYRRARLALRRGVDEEGNELAPVNQAALDAEQAENSPAVRAFRDQEARRAQVTADWVARGEPSGPLAPYTPPADRQVPVPPASMTVIVNNSPGAIVHVDASRRITGPGVGNKPRRRVTEKTTRQVIETTERIVEE